MSKRKKKASPNRKVTTKHASGATATGLPYDLAPDDDLVSRGLENDPLSKTDSNAMFSTHRRNEDGFQDRPDTAGAQTLARDPMSSPEIDVESADLNAAAHLIDTDSKIKVRKRRVVKDANKHVLQVRAPKAGSRAEH